MGLLDLEQKSSADEREAYKGTLSEETAIQKEHKKKKFAEFQPKKQQSIKLERRNRIFNGILALFGLCLNEAVPFAFRLDHSTVYPASVIALTTAASSGSPEKVTVTLFSVCEGTASVTPGIASTTLLTLASQ